MRNLSRMKSHVAIHDKLTDVWGLLVVYPGPRTYPFPSLLEEHEKGVVDAASDAYCRSSLVGISAAGVKELKQKVGAVYEAFAHIGVGEGCGPEETYRVVSKALRALMDCRGLLGKAEGGVEALCTITNASLEDETVMSQLTPMDLERMHECLTAAERALREGAAV